MVADRIQQARDFTNGRMNCRLWADLVHAQEGVLFICSGAF